MDGSDSVIRSDCPLYACGYCRTKTGRTHQPWCRSAFTPSDCSSCRYSAKGVCIHPARRKGVRNI